MVKSTFPSVFSQIIGEETKNQVSRVIGTLAGVYASKAGDEEHKAEKTTLAALLAPQGYGFSHLYTAVSRRRSNTGTGRREGKQMTAVLCGEAVFSGGQRLVGLRSAWIEWEGEIVEEPPRRRQWPLVCLAPPRRSEGGGGGRVGWQRVTVCCTCFPRLRRQRSRPRRA